jgi:hypothetical protein
VRVDNFVRDSAVPLQRFLQGLTPGQGEYAAGRTC